MEFIDEYTDNGRTVIDVIPTSWITGPEREECFWPTGRTVDISKAVKKRLTPGADWEKYSIRVLGNAGNLNHLVLHFSNNTFFI